MRLHMHIQFRAVAWEAGSALTASSSHVLSIPRRLIDCGNSLQEAEDRSSGVAGSGLSTILTLMMDAISFLITERSRVNLHICRRHSPSGNRTSIHDEALFSSSEEEKTEKNHSSPQSLCHDRAPQPGRRCEGCRCF